MTEARRLAAIMAVDVVGYSRLMGEDEAGRPGRCASTARRLGPSWRAEAVASSKRWAMGAA